MQKSSEISGMELYYSWRNGGNLLAYCCDIYSKSLVYFCEITLVLTADKIGYFDMGFSPQN